MPGERRLTVSRDELKPDGGDTVFRQFVHDMLAFSSRIQEIRNGFAALTGVSGTQYTILITLARLQGEDGIGVNSLAEHLHLSGAFITIEVNRLVAAGLVHKAPDTADRRRVRMRITPEAERRLAELTRVQVPVNDALFESLSRAEFETMSAVMHRLVDHGDEALALLQFYLAKTRPKEAARAR